jgi:uncharacterized protein YlxW (UPF0749 family)
MRDKKPKIIIQRSLIAIVCISFGMLVSAQLRSIPDRVTNPIAPYSSLKETREDLYLEQADLKSEIKSLQASIHDAQIQNENSVLTKDEIRLLYIKKAQAGLQRLNGPGVIVKLDDSHISQASDESIIHAADLRDIVNLLWFSGAEGVAINNQRIVSSTAIDCIVNTILINNVRISTPFQIEAIGDQNYLRDGLMTSQTLSSLYQRKNDSGIVFDFIKNDDLTLPVFDGSFDTNIAPNV